MISNTLQVETRKTIKKEIGKSRTRKLFPVVSIVFSLMLIYAK
ncbi:hypothetical protein B6N60_00207 [Richelia sinica FACHB-800]|uniref:Uncharacterized protein n=1 Tax=Richelia sinica FACHB-800 TaxID=1357546 RepID=A0A975T3G1_9NOST|nr:hypothetical protein B6N60_00207 [Richelia sinica FACHB-800]